MRYLPTLFTLLFGPLLFAAGGDFADRPLLIKEIDGTTVKSSFIGYLTKDPQTGFYKASHLSYISDIFIGACLKEDLSPCTLETTYKDLYEPAFKAASGKANLDVAKTPFFPAVQVTLVTTVEKSDSSSLEVTVAMLNKKSRYLIQKVGPFSNVQMKLTALTKDESQRKDITEVDEGLKNFARSVVQIQKDFDGNNALHDNAGQGSGFFISDDGYLMSNHHVVSMYPDCLNKLYCEMKLNQVLPDHSRKTFLVKAHLLAVSSANDFALLKIKIPSDMKIKSLPIDLKATGEDLMTLGFPGDRRTDDGTETKLTYSFGKLTGFYALGLVSSVYISAGASGSPMLNAHNGSLTGIISNGTGSDMTGEGDPGIFRPISLIESEFKITDYLDGSKQKRIQEILKQLAQSENSEKAQSLLESMKKEKTFYGVPYLKQIMIGHQNASVRKTILKALQEMDVVAGK